MTLVSSPLSAWLVVLLSGLLEVAFSVAMKLSEGYSRAVPATVSIVAAVLSVWLMSLTLRQLPLGTAYAVWAGIGAAGTATVGMLAFGEPVTAGRLLCLGAVIAGIVGLQLQGAG